MQDFSLRNNIKNKYFKDINIEKVLAFEIDIIYKYRKTNKKSLIKYRLKENIKLLKKSYTFYYKKNKHDSNISCFKSLNRKDYDIIWKNILSTIESYNEFIYSEENSRWILLVSIYKFIKYSYFLLQLKGNFIERIYLYIALINKLNFYNSIPKIKTKYLLVFSDMQWREQLFVLKNFSKISITCQHALYVKYNHYTINRINFENIVSDIFLSWGQETIDQIYSIHKNVKALNVGHPVKLKKLMSKENYSKNFIVFLDIDEYVHYNKILIEISKELVSKTSFEANVKFHPYNNKELYESKLDFNYKKVDEIFKCDFAIGHLSTMIYSIMQYSIPSFKLKSKECSQKIINSYMEFKDTYDLIQKIKTKKHFNWIELSKYYISCSGNSSLNNYHEFFKKLN